MGMYVGESACVGYSLILDILTLLLPPLIFETGSLTESETDEFSQAVWPVSSQDLTVSTVTQHWDCRRHVWLSDGC